jgi:beta-lactamase regulating signal transducer with metallopeptidase domain
VHLQHVANTLAATLGVGQVMPLRILDHDRGPFTTGLLSPTIVLPSAASGWHPARLRTVLLHELAHVRRHDCRTQALAQLACAVYWFNPLVWIAARGLRRTREGACDDYVLTCGVAPHQYAADLLDIARARQQRLEAGAVLAMGRSGDLEDRLLAIVASGRARVPRSSLLTPAKRPRSPSRWTRARMSSPLSSKHWPIRIHKCAKRPRLVWHCAATRG